MDRFRMLPNYRYYDSTDGVITTQYEKPLRDYKIFGTSTGVGDYDEASGRYKIPVEVNGKNLFNIDNLVLGGSLNISDDGALVVSGYPSGTGKKIIELCPAIKIGQTIAFSMITNGYNQIYLLNLSNGNNRYVSNGEKIVMTEELLNSGVYFYRQTSAQGGKEATIRNIQFEVGNAVTPYEPYREPEIYNILLDEPLYEGEFIEYKSNSDNLPQIKLKKGVNNIIVKTKASPEDVSYQYYA